MPPPAAAPAATRAARLLGQAIAARNAARGAGQGDGSGPGPVWGLLLLLVAVPAGLVLALALLVAVLGGLEQEQCAGAGAPPDRAGPGSLGGVGGTGISRPLVRRVQTDSPYAGALITPGRYLSTSYGPPWNALNGPGLATSGGLPIRGGAPRWYMVATDPTAIAHGTFVYVWPNPFGWAGPFFAADTGGAILSRRIDFYDWRGRASQLRWGTRPVTVTRQPRDQARADAPLATGGDHCLGAPGTASEIGLRIGQIARSHQGKGPNIVGFSPPRVAYAWCAWFATNVWRSAGVRIPLSAWSGFPYTWARERRQLFKAVGRLPRGPTPPVGSALMYGSDPDRHSLHVNLVDKVNPDGSFMVTGGNQDSSRVTRYGPCRLRRARVASLVGPGCDPRGIYGIAMPTRS